MAELTERLVSVDVEPDLPAQQNNNKVPPCDERTTLDHVNMNYQDMDAIQTYQGEEDIVGRARINSVASNHSCHSTGNYLFSPFMRLTNLTETLVNDERCYIK